MFNRNRKQCSICLSDARKDVDAEFRSGEAIVSIAQKYGFSKSAIHRHGQHMGSGDDVAERRLLAGAERALALAEKSGSHPAVLASLKLLGELRRRSRIASPEQPHEGKSKNPDDLIATLRAIYGLKGKGWDKPPEERDDERLIAMLKARVLREDCDGKVAAACTLAASAILGRSLDAESKAEVRRLLGDDEHGVENVVDEVDEHDGEGIEIEAGDVGESADDGGPEPPELDADADEPE